MTMTKTKTALDVIRELVEDNPLALAMARLGCTPEECYTTMIENCRAIGKNAAVDALIAALIAAPDVAVARLRELIDAPDVTSADLAGACVMLETRPMWVAVARRDTGELYVLTTAAQRWKAEAAGVDKQERLGYRAWEVLRLDAEFDERLREFLEQGTPGDERNVSTAKTVFVKLLTAFVEELRKKRL